ncbi:uncharacterized protein LOC116340470 isoform X2 [Contarinia nasturtii]|uniref:uncharacterized protein LOC116340470 isoform X2 n=1 Tax=Contarinia nasturtii TaxID=265458 RepID=UPI0012D478DE|nr:uncharacterized protein LOC116340470 isoform X2 [Contarinia nasturtii]
MSVHERSEGQRHRQNQFYFYFMLSKMLENKIIVLALLITGCYSADDNTKTIITVNANATNTDAIFNETISSTTKLPVSSTTTTTQSTTTTTTTATPTSESFPLLEDLVSAEQAAVDNDKNSNDEKNTAKRTINSKFTGPIVVNEEVNLFRPADDFTRRQRINVQIIEPEAHNNGQFLKQTVFIRQENNTVVTSKTTTTSTTERPSRRKNIVAEQKFLAPIQVGSRLSNDGRPKQLPDEDCDDPTDRPNVGVTERQNRVLENVDIQQNTKIQKIIYKDEPKQNLVFGARVSSTTRNPCEQPCSTTRAYRPSPRIKTFNTTPLPAPRTFTTPRIVTTQIISTPRVLTTPPTLITSTVTPVPVQAPIKPVTNFVPVHHAVVTEKPVYIHTHSQVPIIQKQYVQLPPQIIEKPVVHKEIVQLPPQIQVVEKPKVVIQKEFIPSPPQEKIIPVEVEKLVVKEVPITNVIEKHIEHPPTIVEKLVPYPVASKPIEVEKIIHVPVEKQIPINHIVEKPVAVPYVQYVDRPIHIPYILPVEVPVAYHWPFLLKQPMPPPQKFIIKTTKYGKGHGLFDWKHNHLKHIKHVIIKKPNHILADDIIAPPTIDSIGLLPPPRFQPYINEDFGPKASASINVVSAVLPNSVHSSRDQFFEPSPISNGFSGYDNKLKFVDSFSKDIRWEYGFKPPLVPSVAIDEFGNPLNEH